MGFNSGFKGLITLKTGCRYNTIQHLPHNLPEHNSCHTQGQGHLWVTCDLRHRCHI